MSNDIAIILNAVKNLKTGWKTSEFWVALSPLVVGILGVFGVGVTSNSLTQTLTIGWTAVAAVYVAARTFLKSVHIGHAANLAAILKQLEAEGLKVVEGVAAGKVDVTPASTPTSVSVVETPPAADPAPVVEPDPGVTAQDPTPAAEAPVSVDATGRIVHS